MCVKSKLLKSTHNDLFAVVEEGKVRLNKNEDARSGVFTHRRRELAFLSCINSDITAIAALIDDLILHGLDNSTALLIDV